MTEKTLWVAIIGAGPAGYYTAEALTKHNDKALVKVRVDIMDCLPTPFGLIRAGVAPDHQSIKNVTRRYENTNLRDDVRFVGNIALGRDISVQEVSELYDAVVLATGAAKDRPLGVGGESLNGVIGSGAFVSWYNSHPDFRDLAPDLTVPAVTVIGNGNVAVDVARVLAKTAHEMETSDLAGHAARAIHSSPIRDIYIVGRRGPLEASFTPKEMGEFNELENCIALVNPDHLPDENDAAIMDALTGQQKKNMVHLRKMAENRPEQKPVRLHLMFYHRPVKILGEQRVCGIQLEKTRVESNGKCIGTGKIETLPTGLVVPCIGYKTSPIPDIPYDDQAGRFTNEDGFIAPGLYCVGWARRGPSGTIGTNKPDGIGIAAKILTSVTASGKQGRIGLDALAAERGLKLVTFQDWKKIEAAEIAAASGDHPRAKFSSVDDMVEVVS